MNISTPDKVQIITLDVIAQLKAQKLKEVQQAKADMAETLHNIFAPVQKQTGSDGFMHHIHTGIAVFEGMRTGIKIIKRVKSLFHKKKR